MSEINIINTQLNVLCLIKKLTTHYCSNFNAIIKSFTRLFFFNMISFKNHERRFVYTNVYNERTLIIVKFVNIIVIKSFIFK